MPRSAIKTSRDTVGRLTRSHAEGFHNDVNVATTAVPFSTIGNVRPTISTQIGRADERSSKQNHVSHYALDQNLCQWYLYHIEEPLLGVVGDGGNIFPRVDAMTDGQMIQARPRVTIQTFTSKMNITVLV